MATTLHNPDKSTVERTTQKRRRRSRLAPWAIRVGAEGTAAVLPAAGASWLWNRDDGPTPAEQLRRGLELLDAVREFRTLQSELLKHDADDRLDDLGRRVLRDSYFEIVHTLASLEKIQISAECHQSLTPGMGRLAGLGAAVESARADAAVGRHLNLSK